MNDATTTLLYIDDDDALARLVDRGLTRRGFNVVHAKSGTEGLDRIAEVIDRLNVILTQPIRSRRDRGLRHETTPVVNP